MAPENDSFKSYAFNVDLSRILTGLIAILLVCMHHHVHGGHINYVVNVSKLSQNIHHKYLPNEDMRNAISSVKRQIKSGFQV